MGRSIATQHPQTSAVTDVAEPEAQPRWPGPAAPGRGPSEPPQVRSRSHVQEPRGGSQDRLHGIWGEQSEPVSQLLTPKGLLWLCVTKSNGSCVCVLVKGGSCHPWTDLRRSAGAPVASGGPQHWRLCCLLPATPSREELLHPRPRTSAWVRGAGCWGRGQSPPRPERGPRLSTLCAARALTFPSARPVPPAPAPSGTNSPGHLLLLPGSGGGLAPGLWDGTGTQDM